MADPPLFTVTRRVGRLIEARVFSLKTGDDVSAYGAAIAACVASAPFGVSPILCADHRPVRVYAAPAADGLTALFAHNNSRLARAGLVLDRANATLWLQLDRIVREAKYDRRKVFADANAAALFLDESLDDAERARVRAFLSEWVPVVK
ncbi:MAG: hypothetical protein Q8Q09_17180 [Deltaproteobacteria bacterium]|nr:hypothetical protein [Deltaproteobacteria bacterium]